MSARDNMPDNYAVSKGLLRILRGRRNPVSPTDIYDPLADLLKVTSSQRALQRNTQPTSLWHNRVQAARDHLVKKGLLDNSRHGLWSLTDAGRAKADEFERMGDPFAGLEEL